MKKLSINNRYIRSKDMKYVVSMMVILGMLASAGLVYACCGSSWTAPPPPPPPAPASSKSAPTLQVNTDNTKVQMIQTFRGSKTGDWVRPMSVINEFGIYTFSTLNNSIYYKVETNDGSVFMSRY
jgi:hypothetical protein